MLSNSADSARSVCTWFGRQDTPLSALYSRLLAESKVGKISRPPLRLGLRLALIPRAWSRGRGEVASRSGSVRHGCIFPRADRLGLIARDDDVLCGIMGELPGGRPVRLKRQDGPPEPGHRASGGQGAHPGGLELARVRRPALGETKVEMSAC
jgi:hypothetical protein